MPKAPRSHRTGHPVLRAKAAQEYEARRGSARSRGYDAEWARVSREFLKQHPFCMCGKTATCVDHKVPVRVAPHLRLSPGNWNAMCAACHAAKTARHDGGFGNPRQP